MADNGIPAYIIFGAMEVKSYEEWAEKSATIKQHCLMCAGKLTPKHDDPTFTLTQLLHHLLSYHKGVTPEVYFKYIMLTRA
jgi:hypothetical protein